MYARSKKQTNYEHWQQCYMCILVVRLLSQLTENASPNSNALPNRIASIADVLRLGGTLLPVTR